mmetsp:Transcript_1116/g.1939  ORF Transcript_1116/g.1939 Transcript_1116/m.1939 type:complete len:163 (+) Transcript_1116:17-505(+)
MDSEYALLQEVLNLRQDVARLANRLSKDQSRWTLRHTESISLLSNVLVGCWVFLSRYELFIRKSNRVRGYNSGTFTPPALKGPEGFLTVVHAAYVHGILRSWPFFLSSFLLASSSNWKRFFGYALSTGYSLFLAFRSTYMPWVYHFNIFCIFLYFLSLYNAM